MQCEETKDIMQISGSRRQAQGLCSPQKGLTPLRETMTNKKVQMNKQQPWAEQQLIKTRERDEQQEIARHTEGNS